MPNSLPSSFKIPFASLLVYSPRGDSEISEKSRTIVRDGVKYDRPGILKKAMVRLLEVLEKGQFGSYFGKDVTLVPIPRSSPMKGDSLWVPMRMCEELQRVGLGHSIRPGLVRICPITKAAFAARGERPTPKDHFESLDWRGNPPPTDSILLVDDFITKGSAMMGSAGFIDSVFPDVEIAAFGLVRTLGQVKNINKLLDPCTGRVNLNNGVPNRYP